MKASGIMLAAMIATGQALATANGVLATPLGGAADFTALDRSPPFVWRVQDTERMDRLWQHRSILEQALQAPPEAPPEASPARPRARPLQVPVPQPELSASPLEPETAAVPEQLAEASDDAVSCEEAAGTVADYGFSAIRPIACSGDVYRFSATRDGTAYSIAIAAAAGDITEVSRE